jgi:hypothetical protein
MTIQLPAIARRATPKPAHISAKTRDRDELILEWLACRTAGESCYSIATRYGVSRGQVVAATGRVRDADFAECGETIFVGEYWA